MQFLDLKLQYRSIKKEIDIAIRRVVESSRFIGGAEVENFEREIAKFCDTKYAVGVNSGTDALLLALRALEIGSNDEVITTPFTFIATAEIISITGAKPVFVDIDPKTFNIDPSKIEKRITKRTRAIIPVHLFGQMANMSAIMRVARKYKLKVIEDAAQAIGSNYKNKKAGSVGDMGCFSFFPSKNLGAYGDGGMIVTNNRKLADKVKLLRNHGSSPKEKYKNLVLGTNSRLDAIQAAILRVKLQYLAKWSRERSRKAIYYNAHLSKINEIESPYIAPNYTHIFHQYTIRIKNSERDRLKEYLNKHNVPTMVYYPLPLHLQPAFEYLNHRRGEFPKAEKAAKEVLSLPIYPEIKRREQDYIIKKIKEFYEKEK